MQGSLGGTGRQGFGRAKGDSKAANVCEVVLESPGAGKGQEKWLSHTGLST